jgi:hypothetical protein
MGLLLITAPNFCNAECRATSACRRTTAHFTVVSTVLWSGYVETKTVSCVPVCLWMWFWYQWYNNNFLDRSYYKESIAVLSALNLVFDFVKCNHPIGALVMRLHSAIKGKVHSGNCQRKLNLNESFQIPKIRSLVVCDTRYETRMYNEGFKLKVSCLEYMRQITNHCVSTSDCGNHIEFVFPLSGRFISSKKSSFVN